MAMEIEKTSKKWKLLWLVAAALGFAGCGAIATGNGAIGGVFWMLSFGAWLVSRAGAWWTNG